MFAAADPIPGPRRTGVQATCEEGEVTAKEITDRVWERIESGALDDLDEYVDPDVEFRGVGVETHGSDELKAFLSAYLEAFPDLAHEVRDHVEADGTIALELHVRGTHTGTLRGPDGDVPATGRPVLWVSADYIKVRGGRVTNWHAYTDMMAFLTQLGLVPAGQPA
jgi:ketosteroid isomerase-like protein